MTQSIDDLSPKGEALAAVLHAEFGKLGTTWADLSAPGKKRWLKKAGRVLAAWPAALSLARGETK